MGSDGNVGTTMDMPFKTLSRVSGINLLPDDSILLHTHGVHTGSLTLNDVCGDKEHNVVVSAYDTRSGRRQLAHIYAVGRAWEVCLNNCSNVKLS